MRHTAKRFAIAAMSIALCAVWLGPTAQADTTFASLINKAGRQRMLSQRIVLSYVEIGLGVFAEQARARLDADIALFDAQLAELKAAAPTTDVVKALAGVDALWTPFRQAATAEVSRSGARHLLFWSDDLLFATNKVVQLLQDLSGQPYSRLVNIAGRQRMLSQRMAKFYMLREWGLDTITSRDEMERARNEFAGALAALQGAPENTDAIREELEAAAVQWAWFDNALSLTDDATFRLVVADSSAAVLERMERVTGLYEQLSAK